MGTTFFGVGHDYLPQLFGLATNYLRRGCTLHTKCIETVYVTGYVTIAPMMLPKTGEREIVARRASWTTTIKTFPRSEASWYLPHLTNQLIDPFFLSAPWPF